MAGSHEVRGSIPLCSTIYPQVRIQILTCFFMSVFVGQHRLTDILGLSFKKCVLLDYSRPVIRRHMKLLPNDACAMLVWRPIPSF